MSEVQNYNLSPRAKQEAKKVLNEIGIDRFKTFDDIGEFIDELGCRVSGLVTAKECNGEQIDQELLDIYDLLTGIAFDYEEDIDYMNKLIFD